ncbi:MerR family DNA-binding protein [Glycomyces buryatensis]|uniref:MerR family DNA-binding protein n=1 Tax=Glycomyces buryatensis TaxID=2570927 RepID=UPI001B3C1777
MIHAVERTSGNQRRYRAADIEWVRFLLRLREIGMGIAGMRDYARLRARGESTLEERMELLEGLDADIDAQMARLQANQQALHEKIAIYKGQIEHRDSQRTATA